MSEHADYHQRDDQRGKSIADYWPLIVLIAIAILAALALKSGLNMAPMAGMHFYMGIALCLFAMLKLFDLSGFRDGFAMYDLVTKRFSYYAWMYPFIELLLGLSYLAFFAPVLTYLLTIVVFGVGTLGVYRALQNNIDIYCPCMGSVLKVPLSTVSLIEDVSMVVMALLMLLTRIFS